jgi:hypothetical protein
MKSFIRLALGLAILCFYACEKAVSLEDYTDSANAILYVRTMAVSTSEEEDISYPIQVYVFSGQKCAALQTIADESQTLSIPLVEGNYSVLAIGGASSDTYSLPTQANAVPSMEITLQEGKSHADLMLAKSNVTLVDGGTNTLTLAMERKVMQLQSVVLEGIPSAATAVSVTISPLWEKLNGTDFAGETGALTVALTKETGSRTWKLANSQYLLPPSDSPAAITVNVVKSEGTSSYTYNTAEQLEEGYKINIEGTYTEAIGVTLGGTITGSAWKGEKNISFEFNESGSTGVEDENTGNEGGAGEGESTEEETPVIGDIPAVGSIYQGCYVISVNENNDVVDVLLLSPKSKSMGFVSGTTTAQALAAIETALPECSVSGINGWRLMTRDEATLLSNRYADYSKIGIKNDSEHRLLVIENEKVKPVTMGMGQTTSASFSSTDLLRPVAIIQIQAEE